LTAEILSPDGREFYRDTLAGRPDEAQRIGAELGRRLLDVAGPDFQRRFKG
jgi:hypothetical protein